MIIIWEQLDLEKAVNNYERVNKVLGLKQTSHGNYLLGGKIGSVTLEQKADELKRDVYKAPL